MPNVPGEVYAAVMTNREEFMTLLEGRIKGGAVITKEDMLGMIQLVRDEIRQRAQDRETLNLLQRSVKKLRDAGSGILKAGMELEIIIDKVDRGETVTVDELGRLVQIEKEREG